MPPRRNRLSKAWLAIALLTAGVLACVTNPVTGRREISLMSLEQEKALGRQAAEQVEAEIGLVSAPNLARYVDAIGQRLAVYSPRQDVPYRFAVANMPEPNAFALPAGYIYVSRGLLAICNSEDELANVIGHEIGHVAARHAAQRQTQSVGVGILSMLGTVLAGAAGGEELANATAQFGQAVGAGLIASYGRDQERQSDDIGQKLVAQAGWDPDAMADFFTTLQREEVMRTGQQRRPSFYDSHPLTSERITSSQARAKTLPHTARPIASHAKFLTYLEGLLVGEDPAEGVFHENRFLHPSMSFFLEFPEDWDQQNTKQWVGARAFNENAMILLELQGPRGDPREAARQFVEQNQLEVTSSGSARIGGYPAFHARARANSQEGPLGLDLTWIAHENVTFRISGMTPAADFDRFANAFRDTARSFRTLKRGERDSIRELRLRVVKARRGEDLDALSRRTGNFWDVGETAVANALPEDIRLASGQPIKIAVEVPYSR